jgi:hypothetical protein
MRSILFLIFLITASVTFFTKESHRNVTAIDPRVLQEPVQEVTDLEDIIRFNKDGFAYTVKPLYDYDISGIVVHKQNYNTWYSISRIDRVFPVDLCLIWGDNVRSGVYKNSGTKFRQDFRFCLFTYTGGVPVLNEGVSNNHLVIKNDTLEKLAKSISGGDQVRIIGKLVNVEARPLAAAEKYEPDDLIWNTSVNRTDTGAGACETIYIESIEILKKGNANSHLLFTVSLYGMLVIVLVGLGEMVVALFTDPLRSKSSRDQ